MKIAVVGCGGIGGVIAGVLALKGNNPYCIETAPNRMNENGIRVCGKKGNFSGRVKATGALSKDLGTFDVIFNAVKNDNLQTVFKDARYHLCEGGFIVTIQNGIEVLDLPREFSHTKIVIGAVGYNAMRKEYGDYFVTSKGGITVGAMNGANRDDLFILKSLLGPKIEVEYTDNIEGTVWSKFIIVCGVTGLGGISGMRTGELLRRKVARKLFYRIVTEGSLCAAKLGIRLEKFGGAINPEKFGDHEGGYPLLMRYLLMRIIGMKYRGLRSNIQLDLERSVKTEIDYLNGRMVAEGKKAGVETPVNSEIVRITKEIEEEKRGMGVQNLYEIWERVQR
jgi:2-dehydropantoate 2-reductase